jgi:hypothetical protein
MKDFTNFKANAERVADIRLSFDAGASEAQVAFKKLVTYVFDELEDHRDGDKGAPRGLMTKLKDELVIAGFGEKGTLAKSYLNPAFTMASVIHYDKASICVLEVWENFLDVGAELEGSVTNGPLFTPGRLNACWGKLNSSGEETPFEVTMDGIVAKGERPWHTLTIADLSALNKRGTTDPKVEASLKRVFGDPEKLDKRPGELAKVVKGLRKDNESIKSEILEDVCQKLEGTIDDYRDDLTVTLAEAESEGAQARVIEAQKRRLNRAENRADAPIEAQEQVGSEVVSTDDEAVAAIDAADEA